MSLALPVADAASETDLGTFADLWRRLGDVPPERILVQPAPGTASEADVLRLEGQADKRLCELIDGVLVEKTMGSEEAEVALWLGAALLRFVVPRNLGRVYGPDAMLRIEPGRIRLPDVTFLSRERLPGGKRPRGPLIAAGLDLAVEVVSPSNTPRELADKRRDYFAVGARRVWEVDAAARLVRVYTAPDDCRVLTAADTLDGGDVLPGFELPLGEFFAEFEDQE